VVRGVVIERGVVMTA